MQPALRLSSLTIADWLDEGWKKVMMLQFIMSRYFVTEAWAYLLHKALHCQKGPCQPSCALSMPIARLHAAHCHVSHTSAVPANATLTLCIRAGCHTRTGIDIASSSLTSYRESVPAGYGLSQCSDLNRVTQRGPGAMDSYICQLPSFHACTTQLVFCWLQSYWY